MLSIQNGSHPRENVRSKVRVPSPNCGTGVGRTALVRIRSPVMKARYFHQQPRWGRVGPIAHVVEDDDQIETWMIGQGQEPSGNRHIVVRSAWDRC